MARKDWAAALLAGQLGAGAAPLAAEAGQPAGTAPNDPVALMQAYQAYLNRSGNKRDPIMRAMNYAKPREDGGVAASMGPGGKFVAQRVAGHGARAGQTYSEFRLSDGRSAHIYYSPSGKRRVFIV